MRRDARVGCLAVELVPYGIDGQSGGLGADASIGRMPSNDGVYTVEHAVPGHEDLGSAAFLSGTAEQLNSALDAMGLHRLLRRQRSGTAARTIKVVPAGMAVFAGRFMDGSNLNADAG